MRRETFHKGISRLSGYIILVTGLSLKLIIDSPNKTQTIIIMVIEIKYCQLVNTTARPV